MLIFLQRDLIHGIASGYLWPWFLVVTFRDMTGSTVSFQDTFGFFRGLSPLGLAIPVENSAPISPYKAFLWKQRGVLN